jgi:hypothetical protein
MECRHPASMAKISRALTRNCHRAAAHDAQAAEEPAPPPHTTGGSRGRAVSVGVAGQTPREVQVRRSFVTFALLN